MYIFLLTCTCFICLLVSSTFLIHLSYFSASVWACSWMGMFVCAYCFFLVFVIILSSPWKLCSSLWRPVQISLKNFLVVSQVSGDFLQLFHFIYWTLIFLQLFSCFILLLLALLVVCIIDFAVCYLVIGSYAQAISLNC